MTTTQEVTAMRVGELLELARWASEDESRPGLCQVRFESTYVAATNGHRLVIYDLPEARRGFGIGAGAILRGLAGYESDGGANLELAISVNKGCARIEVKGGGSLSYSEVLISAVVEAEFPPVEQVLPEGLRHGGWIADEDRVLRPHAVAARYLEGVERLWRAFSLESGYAGGGVGIELLHAKGSLETVAWGSRFHDSSLPADAEGRLRRLVLVIMPMIRDDAEREAYKARREAEQKAKAGKAARA
jgi:hypothetical protein